MAYRARAIAAVAGSVPRCHGQLRTLQRRRRSGAEKPRTEWSSEPTPPILVLRVMRVGCSAMVRTTVSAIVKAARKDLWICRCAWTTLPRRPQLHRANINKHLYQKFRKKELRLGRRINVATGARLGET